MGGGALGPLIGQSPPRAADEYTYMYGEFMIDNRLVRIHFIIMMIRRTGLAPWDFEFTSPGSLTSIFPQVYVYPVGAAGRGVAVQGYLAHRKLPTPLMLP